MASRARLLQHLVRVGRGRLEPPRWQRAHVPSCVAFQAFGTEIGTTAGFVRASSSSAGSSSASSSSAQQNDEGDVSVRALLSIVRRAQVGLRKSGALREGTDIKSVDVALQLIVTELQTSLRDTTAPPTYTRLVSNTLDPCWNWAAGSARLRTPRAVANVLERLERRLLQLSQAEQNADTSFESLRMDLGAGDVQTGGTTDAPALGSGEAAQRKATARAAELRVTDRNFLSHDGVAGRTVGERSRNADRRKLERGVAAAHDYRNSSSPRYADQVDIDDADDVEQRVEDQIQIAIAKGEFDNLEGAGKPLQRMRKEAENPFLDTSEKLGFDLLQKHGFAPEWIEQQKAIRVGHDRAIKDLAAAWLECEEEPTMYWLSQKDAFEKASAELNRKVTNYNLICPGASQLPRFIVSEDVRRVRRTAREILGRDRNPSPSKNVAATAAPKRLMTPLSEVLSRRRREVPTPGSDRSLWSRIKDAVVFNKHPQGS